MIPVNFQTVARERVFFICSVPRDRVAIYRQQPQLDGYSFLSLQYSLLKKSLFSFKSNVLAIQKPRFTALSDSRLFLQPLFFIFDIADKKTPRTFRGALAR